MPEPKPNDEAPSRSSRRVAPRPVPLRALELVGHEAQRRTEALEAYHAYWYAMGDPSVSELMRSELRTRMRDAATIYVAYLAGVEDAEEGRYSVTHSGCGQAHAPFTPCPVAVRA
jgi:hypothetical protein